MTVDKAKIDAAIACIKASSRLISEGKNETVIRDSFTSYLRQIFPNHPSWVEHHISGAEAQAAFSRAGVERRGFVDNLVDLTAIEYEQDLTSKPKFETGYGQVKDYCSSLLNEGHSPELVVGVLSDTVRWHAYRIKIKETPSAGHFGREHIELEEIEKLDLSSADELAANRLVDFLKRHLGRLASRPLTATSIVVDLGFESPFCRRHVAGLIKAVDKAFTARPEYGQLVETLWRSFVGLEQDPGSAEAFNRGIYTDELYLITLAKLVAANIVRNTSMLSDDNELASILSGDFFINYGLTNLVEYDYFGWLNTNPFVEDLLPIAKAIQHDLRAYNFSKIQSEDLFGPLMAQLAKRTHRLLLGQEWTPSWLARLMVDRVLVSLPEGESPQLIDMCCGSGTIIVEALKAVKSSAQKSKSIISKDDLLNRLISAITGFDIDPLAVILAKINWILAMREVLEPFGSCPVTIPVFHADSLFATAPLSHLGRGKEDPDFFNLYVAHRALRLPRFLISPDFQSSFDCILDSAYELAKSSQKELTTIPDADLEEATKLALARATTPADEKQSSTIKAFLLDLAVTINHLTIQGKNGLWIFILRNCYRPGLVVGQFNGLVSNPPWLALSRIADNPFKVSLKQRAEQLGLAPAGPAFLHVEISTVFLAHSIERYLRNGAAIACVAPDSVLNGLHHEPFRKAAYVTANVPVAFTPTEIWKVDEHTFKNKAIVLLGEKKLPTRGSSSEIIGGFASDSGIEPRNLQMAEQGKRTAWEITESETYFVARERTNVGPTDALNTQEKNTATSVSFTQGADIMPRTVFFHQFSPILGRGGTRQWQLDPIDHSGKLAFVVKEAKKLQSFKLPSAIVPDELVFEVLTSNLLSPFLVSRPLQALLAIKKTSASMWAPLDATALAAKGSATVSTFRLMADAVGGSGNIQSLWDLINTRNKLNNQVITGEKHLLLTGTSGSNVCAAFLAPADFASNKLIVDQTLNWAQVDSEDEAVYFVGLLNSNAINLRIRTFQPEGAFGPRHIHSLPYRVTPEFDPAAPTHRAVIQATRDLMKEYKKRLESDSQLKIMLDPSVGTLARRRSKATQALQTLETYQSYSKACNEVYGVNE